MSGHSDQSMTGALRPDGADRYAVRFERRYGSSPVELWSALTEPDRLRRWLGADVVDGELAPGGEFTFRWDGADQWSRCRVLTFDPPRALELTWSFPGEPDSVLRLELTAAAGGTALVLDHRQLPTGQASGYGAGWHAYLDALAVTDVSIWADRFTAALPAYQRQFAALG